MTPYDLDELRVVYEKAGQAALVQWVREYRDSIVLVDTTADHIRRLLELFDDGGRDLAEDLIDFTNPAAWDVAREFVLEKLRSNQPLGQVTREIAARILEGKNVTAKRGRATNASTAINTTVAYHCVPSLEKLGLPVYLSTDRNPKNRPTACSIVAEAFGVSASQVEKWIKAKRQS